MKKRPLEGGAVSLKPYGGVAEFLVRVRVYSLP